jgi:hypothetical protein
MKFHAIFDNVIMVSQSTSMLNLGFRLKSLIHMMFSPLSSEAHNQTLLDVRSMLPHQDGKVPTIQRHTRRVSKKQPSPQSRQIPDLWEKQIKNLTFFA